ncbi:hypothetical protein FSP39_015972 [Pinctada imbricata]|uniref:Major facilitator superfamily (MFS) profile domain-containing protein n=1 Tax=Pinctada imbricata TaxID=66713 RepID=A0AA88XFY0_PINIB|nr:hypothetical protein FSP39_015972 [Pinctada imbricata]
MGFSLCLISSFSIAPKYFTGKRRLFVTGFITVGAGVGALVFPVIIQLLLRTYNWRGVSLIFSDINLNMLVSAMLFVNKSQYKQEQSKSPSIMCTTTLRGILTNGVFMGYCIAVWILYPCFNNVLIFFIDFFESHGIPRSTCAWLLTGTNVANTLARLIPPFLSQFERIPKLAILAAILPIAAVVFVMFPFAKSFMHFVILVCIFGICLGVKMASLSLIAFHIIGAEGYPIGLGILMTGYGISNVIAGPIAG